MLAENESGRATRAIRRLNDADVPAVWQLFQAAPEAADWSEISIRNSLRDSQTIALASACDQEIVGCIFGTNIAGEAEILNLAVKTSHRRQGIASQLVRGLLDELATQGVERVFLEVRESNAGAIGLYEGFGFRQTGRRKRYYAAPEEDALVLERPGQK